MAAMSSPGYLSSSSQQMPGNVAMFDMAVAMNWIKDYISFFGGNPKNIVTMGQGSGASSAMMMGLSPMTQGRLCRYYIGVRKRNFPTKLK